MKKWYCLINGKTFGPYSKDQLKVKADKGTIGPDTLVRGAGLEKIGHNWIRAGEAEISDIFPKSTSAPDDSRIPVNSGGREEEHKDDVKDTIILKILQMIMESKVREFFLIFGLIVLVVFLGLLMRYSVLVIGLIALIVLTAMVLRHRRLQRQQDIEILNANISKIGDDEAARRAEKYRDK
ncbi:MAG: GYF domain-containing protein [Synergistaceae bacterium]|jgi:hypothetical protein|nr:GYF domain-containing protein [Synergistaceae bacterium]